MNLNNLAPHPMLPSDLSKPCSSLGHGSPDNSDMKYSDTRDPDGFAIMTTLVLILAAFAALAACAPSTAYAPEPEEDLLILRADESNDSFQDPTVLRTDAASFQIEGTISHMDLDCIVVYGGSQLDPFGERTIYLQWDYAAGWDMEVSASYEDLNGDVHNLWGAYDSHGSGYLETTVQTPPDCDTLWLSIGQRSLHNPPDQTLYTITVETF